MQKIDGNKKAAIFFVLLILIFYLCHSSPIVAVRTKLVFSGCFDSGFTSGIFLDEKTDENTSIYKIEKVPIKKATGGRLDYFRVRRYSGIFYFAEYRGQA